MCFCCAPAIEMRFARSSGTPVPPASRAWPCCSNTNRAGWEIRDSFAQAAAAAGLASDTTASVSRGSVHVDPALAALVAANPPQAIILAANPTASAAFVRGARKAGFGGTFYTVSTVGGQVLLDQLGQLAVGISVAQVVVPLGRWLGHPREFLVLHDKITPTSRAWKASAARWLTEA